jgi:hypothetical protein
MAPVSLAFIYLLSLHGKPVQTAVRRLREQWGRGLRSIQAASYKELRSELAPGDPETADRWILIGDAAATGDFETFVQQLILQNKTVMAFRGGAPWLDVQEGRFNVRFRDEQGALPTAEESNFVWRHPYFLDSLREIARYLQEQ